MPFHPLPIVFAVRVGEKVSPEQLLVTVLVLGGIFVFDRVMFPICKLVQRLRPDSGRLRRWSVRFIVFVALVVMAFVTLPLGTRLAGSLLSSSETWHSFRSDYPPEPNENRIPMPAEARIEGSSPGDKLSVTVLTTNSLLGHYRSSPFVASMTLPANEAKGLSSRTFHNLEVVVSSNDWEDPLHLPDSSEADPIAKLISVKTIIVKATVRLPTGENLVGRTGKLTLIGTIWYPSTVIEKDTQGKPFVRVEQQPVVEKHSVPFISVAERAAANEAREKWVEELRRAKQVHLAWEQQKDRIDSKAESDYADHLRKQIAAFRLLGGILAGLGLVIAVVLTWPNNQTKSSISQAEEGLLENTDPHPGIGEGTIRTEEPLHTDGEIESVSEQTHNDLLEESNPLLPRLATYEELSARGLVCRKCGSSSLRLDHTQRSEIDSMRLWRCSTCRHLMHPHRPLLLMGGLILTAAIVTVGSYVFIAWRLFSAIDATEALIDKVFLAACFPMLFGCVLGPWCLLYFSRLMINVPRKVRIQTPEISEATDSIVFPCDHCDKELEFGKTVAGTTIRCPHCRRVVLAPSLGESSVKKEV